MKVLSHSEIEIVQRVGLSYWDRVKYKGGCFSGKCILSPKAKNDMRQVAAETKLNDIKDKAVDLDRLRRSTSRSTNLSGE